MNRDWMFGVAMAGAVALYPNLIQAALYLSGVNDLGSKCWLIFFSTAGPALFAPALFGVRTKGHRDCSPKRFAQRGRSLLGLAISGLFAAAYFLAVVGFGDDLAGLGAGLAEMIDSSFFPVAYVAWLWFVGIGSPRRGTVERPPLTAIGGAVVICIGLLVLGAACGLDRGGESSAETLLSSGASRTLVLCAIVGAAAAAIALWLLRQLVRTNTVTLGIAVACRYGAPAIACLAFALWRSGLHGLSAVSWAPGLVTFVGGAFLINGIYLAATRIKSDLAQAAAMGLVPLFTFAIERMANRLSLLHSDARANNLAFWVGAAIAICGIVLVWRDPSVKHE